DEGEVNFLGQDITDMAMHRRARLGIGYLTQEPSIFRKLTVEQNILAILETCKMRRAERAIRLKYLLDELDLARLAKSKAYTLSGGEKRRLEITRALVTSPKLLLPGAGGLKRVIREPTVNRPGLVLTGFTRYFAYKRVQAIGNAEAFYLKSLTSEERLKRYETFFSYKIPCVIFSRNLHPDRLFL